ncbi:hypothetical protein C5167_050054 [Papaver somniferum]|uniref:Uncharacterized protein n=1 Tax=Papaver somniferum TaxID=3469 RepID=A0A4Y7KQB4_PAPSO|nr:hypothetical protein C5167_050054 [Papaver somniferum]
MDTLGFFPGYFEGKFCIVRYNVGRVARQLGNDQGLASIQYPWFPADDDDLMKECYRRFVFKPDSPRYCRDRPFNLLVPSPKVPPKFTQAWCSNWYDELTRMIEFVSGVADTVEVTSPRKLNALGRIKLTPEVAAAHGSSVGGTLSPQNSSSSPGSQGIIMGRTEQSSENSNLKRRRHQSGQVTSGSRYPDPIPPPSIGSPNSLVGQATWFDFKGNVAAVATTYAHFLPVYNFPVSPEPRDYYKGIVEEPGHVASTEVLSDRNNLISSVSALVVVAKEMSCSRGWKREERVENWSGEITRLKEEVKAETQKLKEQQKEQVRITAEASKIAAEVATTTTKLQLKQKELADKEAELASFE